MSGSETASQPEEGYAESPSSQPSCLRRMARASRARLDPVAVRGGGAGRRGGAGLYVWSQVEPILSVSNVAVSYVVPSAPHLVAGNGETVYRIDPTQSSVTYGVDENVVGQTAHHATGVTNGIAGDLADQHQRPVRQPRRQDRDQPRAAALRQQPARRHHPQELPGVGGQVPLASFTTTSVTGLPASLTEGKTYHFTLNGKPTREGHHRAGQLAGHRYRRRAASSPPRPPPR